MNEEISITISKQEDAISKYNDNLINKKLILYLIEKSKYIKRKSKIQISIYNKCNLKLDVIDLIKKGLIIEYKNIVKEYKYNHFIQLWLFVLGIIILIVASLLKNISIWHEVLIIIGWVPIWKMMDLELHEDFKGRRKKYLILRLLKSEFQIKKEN